MIEENKELIVSTGGSSSYYDIPFNEEQLLMITQCNRMYFDDFIDIAFGGDPLYKELIVGLYYVRNFSSIDSYIPLSDHYVAIALTDNKLSLDDFFVPLFNNDFDCCTILKSLKRAYEDINGRGKFGSDTTYNLNKIKYSLGKMQDRSYRIRVSVDTKKLYGTLSEIRETARAKHKITK
ncbi:hypothetical protein NVP3058O_097 [Vibrio phage 3.058.O._10N.286.46.B8]|nr:hypothetical protein NVP2058O_098 [Vibrio phage 2.058.O._10N.286.46.B8]AUS03167.1 hypothetical protein NVP3058O_097 [Vibrio phage 3.058.O._10N.286.46.B8]